jgi:hypothetical protein
MMAITVFMGVCVLSILFLLWFLVALFKESAASARYPVKLGVRRQHATESRSMATAAGGRFSPRVA